VDLFAGSGAVGIEAISRGAQAAIFVEKHPAGAALITKNLAALGITTAQNVAARKTFCGTAEVIRSDAIEGLERLSASGVRVDFVFADPPYADSRAYRGVLSFLGESGLLGRSGRLILEHRRNYELPAVSGRLERKRVVQQGDTSLSFYSPVLAA
jgi:16S rRNA (guanine966-N2)-methyltransferase